MTATQVSPNDNASTNSKNMNHAQSVKGAILREMYNFKESHNTVGRKRLMRSNDSSTFLVCRHLASRYPH